MTASEVVSGWPEATVERVAEAETLAEWLEGWCDHVKDDGTTFGPECCPWRKAAATVRSLAAALSVLPDPTADTVLLDQVRQLSAEWDDRGATWCMNRIAALLAEADQ